MRNSRLAATLQKVSDEFFCVSEPDHPLLISGPDALLTTRNSLVAVFTPTLGETTQPVKLLVRMVLARYALPNHARCLLGLDANRDIEDSSAVRNFHEIIRLGDVSGLRRFVSDHRANPHRVRELDRDNRSTFMARYLAARRLSFESTDGRLDFSSELPLYRNSRALRPLERYAPVILKSWTARRRSRSQTVFLDEQSGVLAAFISWDAHRNQTARLRRIIEHGIRQRYSLDGGVLYPTDETAPFIFVDKYRPMGWDPLKVLRATAFAGWCMVPERYQTRVDAESNRLHDLEHTIGARLRDRKRLNDDDLEGGS